MLTYLVAFAGGLILLALAADQFVIGSARLARALRISPIVVGVVVMGFGTSAPELVVSALAAANDQVEIAVGNIVGSNLANLSLLLGIGALVTEIRVASLTVRREAPLVFGATVVYWVLVQGDTTRWRGLVLVLLLFVSLGGILRTARSTDPLTGEIEERVGTGPGAGKETLRAVGGLVGTLVGAQVLLYGATNIADEIGLSEGFVGVTLVAIGTSLPELVTVVQAARRQEVDLIVGNLLGSNLFNLLAVGGVAMLVGPGRVGDASLTGLGMGLVLALTALVWLFMSTGLRVSRGEGVALVVFYAVSIVLLRL